MKRTLTPLLLVALALLSDPVVLAEGNAADAVTVVSAAPVPDSAVRLELLGHAPRNLPRATSDVWVLDGYAYLGTVAPPCGDGTVGETGVQVYDVHDPTAPLLVAALPSVVGGRINDVKVARLSQGDVLVHSNEPCRPNGPGGFEIFDVSNPLAPVHLGHVATRSVNPLMRQRSPGRDDGVHNLVLFTRDGRDYVGSQVSTDLGNFQIWDITEPSAVQLVGFYGAESLRWPDTDWSDERDEALVEEALAWLNSGYGQIANRGLHDLYITPDGLTAYLANWDAGLIRLDLTDLARPTLVSVAIEVGLEDGEVSSHSVWPSADGLTVVEGEEDFHPGDTFLDIEAGPAAGRYTTNQGTAVLPLAARPGRSLAGPTTYVGQGCEELPEAASERHLALIERGVCTFAAKIGNARIAGYAGVVIFNHSVGGDELIPMGGAPAGLSGVFVARSTGLAIAGADGDTLPALGSEGAPVLIAAVSGGLGGLRIWDYSDPARPVLASIFNTFCSSEPTVPECVPRGLTTAHNMIVEGDRAYVSWYGEGVLVIDIADPSRPVELARFRGDGEAFEASNDGAQDVWGIYKVPGEPYLYASDRNGGLYVFEVVDLAR